MKKDIIDRDEPVSMMEPMCIGGASPKRIPLTDMALDLAKRSAGFKNRLPQGIVVSLADLVRSMNCYYSNLIEGHDTHPVDIERALNDDYSSNAHKRHLQLEAKAHIAVQQWLDAGERSKHITSVDAIREIHRRFCDELPEELLWVEDPSTKERMRVEPGELRERDVKVGRHIGVSPGAVPRFLARYEKTYSSLGESETILAIAASHHRLLWIHPFLDGNGRVARLVSHAVLSKLLDTGSIWSVARGLARNEEGYKRHLAACDLPRRNDLDGRGHLTEEGLVAFTQFFLETCLDQVSFMENLVQPDRLQARILVWAREEIQMGKLPQKADIVLQAILHRGELPRGDLPELLGVSARQARRVVSALISAGAVSSPSSRAPLQLQFSAKFAERWMPGLFPVHT